jgi:hypothetical protein
MGSDPACDDPKGGRNSPWSSGATPSTTSRALMVHPRGTQRFGWLSPVASRGLRAGLDCWPANKKDAALVAARSAIFGMIEQRRGR